MPRRALENALRSNTRQRISTRVKRRQGLFKKSSEFGTLVGDPIVVITKDADTGQISTFSNLTDTAEFLSDAFNQWLAAHITHYTPRDHDRLKNLRSISMRKKKIPVGGGWDSLIHKKYSMILPKNTTSTLKDGTTQIHNIDVSGQEVTASRNDVDFHFSEGTVNGNLSQNTSSCQSVPFGQNNVFYENVNAEEAYRQLEVDSTDSNAQFDANQMYESNSHIEPYYARKDHAEPPKRSRGKGTQTRRRQSKDSNQQNQGSFYTNEATPTYHGSMYRGDVIENANGRQNTVIAGERYMMSPNDGYYHDASFGVYASAMPSGYREVNVSINAHDTPDYSMVPSMVELREEIPQTGAMHLPYREPLPNTMATQNRIQTTPNENFTGEVRTSSGFDSILQKLSKLTAHSNQNTKQNDTHTGDNLFKIPQTPIRRKGRSSLDKVINQNGHTTDVSGTISSVVEPVKTSRGITTIERLSLDMNISIISEIGNSTPGSAIDALKKTLAEVGQTASAASTLAVLSCPGTPTRDAIGPISGSLEAPGTPNRQFAPLARFGDVPPSPLRESELQNLMYTMMHVDPSLFHGILKGLGTET
jgi:hypothetical protein